MSWGGARPNTGPKPKYQDNEGNPLETKQVRIPKILTEKDIQDAVRRKLEEEKAKQQAERANK